MDTWTFTCCDTTNEIDNAIRHACCPYCGVTRDRAVYRRNQTRARFERHSKAVERAVTRGFRNALLNLALGM
jgi:hypothetical protein